MIFFMILKILIIYTIFYSVFFSIENRDKGRRYFIPSQGHLFFKIGRFFVLFIYLDKKDIRNWKYFYLLKIV